MTYNSVTTLAEISAEGPCAGGWEKLLARLGKTKADDEPLSLLTILESNGLDDALWCLQAKSLSRLSRHFQAWCAEQVVHHFAADRPDDTRVIAQIEMLKNDNASEEDRAAARDAAWAAALDAAMAAAMAAARDAAWAAAWDAAIAAARVAARAAAWVAAMEAARAAQERQLRKMIGELT